MRKQILVVGLGQFGMALARSLTELGAEVMAVDVREERVTQASDFVADAASFDATDEDALSRTVPKRRDICVCAIGDEAREASIICTALLRQMGAERVVARAADPLHERILGLVGAHQVVRPESEFGGRLATRLATDNVVEELPFGDGMMLTEVELPRTFVGRTLAHLELRKKYGVTVVAIRRGSETIAVPDPHDPMRDRDVLLVVSPKGAIPRMLEKVA